MLAGSEHRLGTRGGPYTLWCNRVSAGRLQCWRILAGFAVAESSLPTWETGPTAKRSRHGITSVCSGGFIPHLKGWLPKLCSVDDINAAQLVKTPRQAVVCEHDEP